MKKFLKPILVLSIAVMLVLSFVGCAKLDVVAQESVTSFEALLNTVPGGAQADEMNGGWSITAPDGSSRFIWSRDYSKSPLHDVMIEFDAQPFIDAGLDVTKLPDTVTYYENKLMVGTKLGADELKYNGEATPLASFEQIVKLYRSSVGYHSELDHYGVALENGNMFEWAKDMSTNDKDIVFVLNPEPFLNAGVDPNVIEGWKFAKVKVDVDGKPTEVDKILKPFDLK
jgi:hypothetical protein